MQEVIKILTEKNKTIATMESCTGGGVVNAITNIEGASDVLKFSAVTYSNEYKIKLGVSSDTIDKYSVYSVEVAREMALNISKFAESNYGIGITGKLNRVDKNNPYGSDNITFVSIYDKDNDEYLEFKIEATKSTRALNKELIINKIIDKMLEVINDWY